MTARFDSWHHDWVVANGFAGPGATTLLHPRNVVLLAIGWAGGAAGITLADLTTPGMTWARLGGHNVVSGSCMDLWLGYDITFDDAIGTPTRTWAGGTPTSTTSATGVVLDVPEPVTSLPTVAVGDVGTVSGNGMLTVPAITPPAGSLFVSAVLQAGSISAGNISTSLPTSTIANINGAGNAQRVGLCARLVATAEPHQVKWTPPGATTSTAGFGVSIALPDVTPLPDVRLYKGRRTAVLDQAGVS